MQTEPNMKLPRIAAAALLVWLVAGCAASSVGSYQSTAVYDRVLRSVPLSDAIAFRGPERNPVVLIHGLLGSRLVDSADGRILWGRFSAELPPEEELVRLAHPMGRGKTLAELTDSVRPAAILDVADVRLAGVGFRLPGYQEAIRQLAGAGFDEIGRDGVPASLYIFCYDWRRDNVENAIRLDRFLRELRGKLRAEYEQCYGLKNYDVQFDLVAHSMGGLIGRYYLMYGAQDLPSDGSLPHLDWGGSRLVDKLLQIGTPNDGYLDTFSELCSGLALTRGAPTWPAAVIATFPSYYQMLPGISGGRVRYAGSGAEVEIFESGAWIRHRWGLADPAGDRFWKAMLPGVGTESGRRAVALDHLEKCLARARQLRRALAVPADPPGDVMLFLFAGDAVETAFELEVDPGSGEAVRTRYSAGDGKVLTSSARFDRVSENPELPFSQSPVRWQGVYHVRAAHMGLPDSVDFQHNFRYALLMQTTPEQRRRFELNRQENYGSDLHQ